jgi:hypothetical protein
MKAMEMAGVPWNSTDSWNREVVSAICSPCTTAAQAQAVDNRLQKLFWEAMEYLLEARS